MLFIKERKNHIHASDIDAHNEEENDNNKTMVIVPADKQGNREEMVLMKELRNVIYPKLLQIAETYDEIIALENNHNSQKMLELKNTKSE